MQSFNSADMRQLILNFDEPYLIKNKLDWGLLNWSLEDWAELLKSEQLKFRCGKNAFTKEPQWERTTSTRTATFEEFITFSKTETNQWMYFDYKYLKEWFSNIPELKKNISWGIFGFPELSSEDSTIWIGSKGAHTPCHKDTYGCNLIAQIYGRKQWILFPPEEDLKPTRIPYEESSVYSKLNFFSPTVEDFGDVKNSRRIVLEPGDVMFVPHKWWHYVENLEDAITINVWIPLRSDHEERLEESLVQFFITQFTKNVDAGLKKIILNPNSDEDVENLDLNASLSLVNNCKKVFEDAGRRESVEKTHSKVPDLTIFSFLQPVPVLSSEDFQQFLQKQKNRFTCDQENTDQSENELFDIINAFTHPETIGLIKNKLLHS